MDAGGVPCAGPFRCKKWEQASGRLLHFFAPAIHSVLGPLLSMHNGRAESRLAVMLAASVGWVLLDKRGGF